MMAIILFTAYLLFILQFKGIGSISQSYYELQKKYKCGFVFTVFCYTLLALVLPIGLSISQDYQFLIFLAAAGLGFVGTAPIFDGRLKNRNEKIILAQRVHYIGALVCLVMSLLWIIFATNLWYIPAILYTLAILAAFRFKKQYLLIIEIAAFYSLLITLLILKN